MTVAASPVPPISYNGAGSAGPFAITFPFLEDSHIVATKTLDGEETLLILDVDYTLTGAGDEEGGSLLLDAILAEEATLEIGRHIPVNQLSEFPRNDPFPADRVEKALDKLTMLLQQIEASIQDFDDAELGDLIDLLLINEDFWDLLTQLITNTLYESTEILQLGPVAFDIPIKSIAGTTATIGKTYRAALVLCTNAAPVIVTLRANDGTEAEDFRNGAFLSLKQKTIAGQVTLVAPDGGSLLVPYGYLAKTRAIGSVITAVCELAESGIWTVSGDMAPDPAASVGGTLSALASTAGAVEINCALGEYFTLDLTEDITAITFINLPQTGFGMKIRVRIRQHAGVAKTMAWPASFKWAGGVAPSISTGLGAYDVLELTTFDQGTRWEASLAKAFG